MAAVGYALDPLEKFPETYWNSPWIPGKPKIPGQGTLLLRIRITEREFTTTFVLFVKTGIYIHLIQQRLNE